MRCAAGSDMANGVPAMPALANPPAGFPQPPPARAQSDAADVAARLFYARDVMQLTGVFSLIASRSPCPSHVQVHHASAPCRYLPWNGPCHSRGGRLQRGNGN